MATSNGFEKINGFHLNAVPDIPDFRDWIYQPALIQLELEMLPPDDLPVLDQGTEGACAGFGLSAVIDMLNRKRDRKICVSPRMLYEMAKRYDEWPGVRYSGSSCRGAIRGWYNMGVCSDNTWPYQPNKKSKLSVKRAKEARENTIGAYYRVLTNIVDFHAALNEAGVLYVSADVHSGWSAQNIKNGKIPFRKDTMGGHAFAIVGYNKDGFFVQNSWGESWGKNGIALWSYKDWQINIRDAWVVRLALPTPEIFPGKARNYSVDIKEEFKKSPSRSDIMGHFVHLDDGSFHKTGRYWSDLNDIKETADLISNSDKYKHLLIYAHGGLNSTKASAGRIKAMKDIFKANEIYPFHFMYDTGLMEEIKDIILNRKSNAVERVGVFSDWTDKLVESGTKRLGRILWREIKQGAQTPFTKNGDGTKTLKAFVQSLKKTNSPIKIHLVGHSTGGILLAYLLPSLKKLWPGFRVSSCSLMAPAGTLGLYYSNYEPYLKSRKTSFGINRMRVYNLNEKLELDDNVAKIYRKSLLYLVSNSFEDENPYALLGMKKYSRKISQSNIPLKFVYSEGVAGRGVCAASRTHGGFDNDPATVNDILKHVLGKKPKLKFKEEDLDY